MGVRKTMIYAIMNNTRPSGAVYDSFCKSCPPRRKAVRAGKYLSAVLLALAMGVTIPFPHLSNDNLKETQHEAQSIDKCPAHREKYRA